MKTSLVTITLCAILVTSLPAFVPTASAEVVYTPVNVTVSGNGSIKFDLNHDGITDFTLHSASHATTCGDRGGFVGSTTITPTTGDGVAISSPHHAAVLASGVSIDGSTTFYGARSVVAKFRCLSGNVAGYLGLEFQISGQTHYGWAQVIITGGVKGGVASTTLVGFANETNTGQAIQTGQTSGDLDQAESAPGIMWEMGTSWGPSPILPQQERRSSVYRA
jgi:hypothetical protein